MDSIKVVTIMFGFVAISKLQFFLLHGAACRADYYIRGQTNSRVFRTEIEVSKFSSFRSFTIVSLRFATLPRRYDFFDSKF